MSQVIDWTIQHYFELLASAMGFIAIFLQIKQNIWYWFVSIIMVSMYIYIYIEAKLYADMSLQVYYLFISFYGWYAWLYGNTNDDRNKELRVSSSTNNLIRNLTGITIILFFAIAWILIQFTNSDLPYWDSFTTALSFVATWMLARKKIENWLIWIVVDAVSVAIYIYKGLYPTAVLFLFLTFLAIIGYRKWKKELDDSVAYN